MAKKRDKVDRRKKSDEIWKIGYDGLPQKFKIVKWNTVEVNGKDDPLHLDYIPIYETCVCCNLSLARIEEEYNLELGGYCLGCFKITTEQQDDSPFGEFLCPVGTCNKTTSIENKYDHTKIKPRQNRSLKKRNVHHD
tara:strand:+ start:2955 stop:3365 length:411 start_codon:yes stop_codon:yes gene_type:complete